MVDVGFGRVSAVIEGLSSLVLHEWMVEKKMTARALAGPYMLEPVEKFSGYVPILGPGLWP